MITYSKASLERSRINDTAETWNKRGLISDTSLKNIKDKYKSDTYTPNLFIRIALFIFTIILTSAALGLLTLITLGGTNENEIEIRLIFYGILTIMVLELLIKNKKIYKAGIDDALLYITLNLIIIAICMFATRPDYDANGYPTNNGENDILVFLIWSFPFLLIASIRYIDSLVAAATYFCLLSIVFFSLQMAGEIGKEIIPFGGIVFSGLIYYLVKQFKSKTSLIIWKDSMNIIEILSLFTFYLSGNYLIVRELSQMIFENGIPEGGDIPLAIVFYIFTALVPFLYLYNAINSKDRIMLRVGLIIFALAVLTFKYYYSLGHHEISLTIAGIIMVSLAGYIFKYLKTPRGGITSNEDIFEKTLLNTNIENIVIAESFKHPGIEKGIHFGGGKFGGGGAGSDY